MKTFITGMGIWSCIGTSIPEVTKSLREGKSGIGHIKERADYGYQSTLSGIVPQVPDSLISDLPRSKRICMGEPARYAYMAVLQAIKQAQLTDLHNVALIVSNDSTAEAAAETEALMQERHDTRYLGAGKVFQSLNSTVSMNLASIFQLNGLSLTLSAACAGGGHAIGIAHSLIQSGQIDCAIVVGAQEVGLHAYTSFDAIGVFSREASRPFDKNRSGLVPSGGAAALILESDEHFRNRMAIATEGGVTTPSHSATVSSGSPYGSDPSPLASILGYGFSTSPSIATPNAESILASMTMALNNAERHEYQVLPAFSLGMISAHATGTKDGDRAEAEAISTFITSSKRGYHESYVKDVAPWISSTKALTGHECWMSGVSQMVYTLIQMHNRFVAPNPNLTDPDDACSTLRIARETTPWHIESHALLNAFGFGGTNSSIVIKKE